MNVTLKYGCGYKTLELPDGADVTVMKPRELPVLPDLGPASPTYIYSPPLT